MQPVTPTSLLMQFDRGLNHAASYLLCGLKHLALWLTGLLSICLYSGLIFDYNEGLADISQFGWVLMLLALLLVWRHCHYARLFGYGFWRGLARGLAAQGVALITEMTVLGLIVLMVLSPEWQTANNAIGEGDVATKTYQLLGQILVLLALYFGAPTRPLHDTLPLPKPETARQDPTISPTLDKEVTL